MRVFLKTTFVIFAALMAAFFLLVESPQIKKKSVDILEEKFSKEEKKTGDPVFIVPPKIAIEHPAIEIEESFDDEIELPEFQPQKMLFHLSVDHAIGSGRIVAKLNYDHEQLEGTATFHDIPLDILQPEEVVFPLRGSISGEATFSGTSTNPHIATTLHARGIALEDPAFAALPPASGEFTVSLDNHMLTCAGNLTAPNHPPIAVTLKFPASFSIEPLRFDIDGEAPIAGNISASGEIAPLIQMASSSIPLSGMAHAQASISGTFNAPLINGTCDLVNGRYEIPEIGVVLSNLSAHIEGAGTKLQITDVAAVDGRGGTLSGSGWMQLDAANKFPFQLDLLPLKTTLLNQDYISLICSGSLLLKGSGDGARLEGHLQLDQGLITIPERPSSVINSVDVTYINLPEHMPAPQGVAIKQAPWPFNLDIHLVIPENLPIRGPDLTSTWKGTIDVQGTAQHPLLGGQLKIVEGQYLFNGNPFEISEGTITFAGDIDKKTTLYVIARKDLDKVQVDIIAKGPVKNPSISFRSNPPLPQREILSWILFNSGTSEISQFQGAQLSESITNLKSNQEGPDVLTKIRSTLGIDRFEISRNPNSDESDVNVQVGKYISDGVLISVIKSDVNRLAIEAALTNRIKLQAQVGDDAEGQLFLKWKRNY